MKSNRRGFFGLFAAAGAVAIAIPAPTAPAAPYVPERCPWPKPGDTIGDTIRVKMPQRFVVWPKVEVIEDALRMVGVLGVGERASADELAFGSRTLRRILEEHAHSHPKPPSEREQVFALAYDLTLPFGRTREVSE